MGYRLDNQGSIPGRGKRFFSTPEHLDKPWGPSSLIPSGYGGLAVSLGHKTDHSPPHLLVNAVVISKDGACERLQYHRGMSLYILQSLEYVECVHQPL
jgi:hypothetical protein